MLGFCFQNPDGPHPEIIEFPRGNDDPNWHACPTKLFLGIDRTAPVVADTETSEDFYGILSG